jgi:hypothetical protein
MQLGGKECKDDDAEYKLNEEEGSYAVRGIQTTKIRDDQG